MKSKMQREARTWSCCRWTSPRCSAKEGAQGSVHLTASPELRDVTGRYFDGTRLAAPSPASLDLRAAARLWALGEQFTGEVPLPRAEVPEELDPAFVSPPEPASAY